MKNKRLIIGLAAVLVVFMGIFTTAFLLNRPETQNGEKNISVTVVFADKSEKEYKINTDVEFLADALLEEKIIDEKSADGMYTVVAGQRADYNLDKSWWCLNIDGQMGTLGWNEQPITDGDSFEIANTPS